MSYTLIISGTKAGYVSNEDLKPEAQTREQAAFRDQEMSDLTTALGTLAASLKSSGHTIREVFLDGEKVTV